MSKINWKCHRCDNPAEGKGSWFSLGWGSNHWEIICATCLTEDEKWQVARYDIELHRLATIEDFDWWTKHLRMKTWFYDTDWPLVLHPHTA